jgi:glycopeptide antibiotics resistance protein
MKRRFIAASAFILYSAVLIMVMVFKWIPTIRIGGVRLRFSGTTIGHPPNLVPFKTIASYLHGQQGLMIAGVNLVGNIAPLVPLGLLLPLARPGITGKQSLLVAVGAGLGLEGMQAVLRVGVFDVDDVILNAFGVMIGYWGFTMVAKFLGAERSEVLAPEA